MIKQTSIPQDIAYTMALVQLLQAVLCIALLLGVDLVDAQNPQLVYIGRSDNRITLECRQPNSLPVSSPQFWVERSDLSRAPVNSGSPQNGRIIFDITQDLEGMYSCSDSNTFSNTLDLVGKETIQKSLGSHLQLW